ncbi:hypothetical protein OR571_15765 [Psychrobacillus sp. NEAU-3TGS]|uniref:hypothetical protein n=1 Tax=Psychrobacillus sp. NEAU-3TGS TaxID=2995412 RepID=UPI002497E14A|nr:hypothetical protein [Psychrobacillus sp. NEAU-3TGS]MDI2588531.1 hypothetical protein [Psychrobacillus sp. NEAU-3TGS]
MYIWNINALVRALKEDSFSEQQKKSYRITFWIIVAITVFSLPIVDNPFYMNKYDIIDFKWASVFWGLIGFKMFLISGFIFNSATIGGKTFESKAFVS